MKKIAFICTGNTCRSPMAEGLCRDALQKSGVDGVQVISAGLAAQEGSAPSENAVLAMQEIGIDISAHRAARATADLLDSADLIVCMSDWQRDALAARYGERATAFPSEICDPFGGDLDRYRACRDQICAAIPQILERIE